MQLILYHFRKFGFERLMRVFLCRITTLNSEFIGLNRSPSSIIKKFN
jgi:hypothetical protein